MSLVEIALIVATLAIFALAIVPSYRNSRDAIAVERAARLLESPHSDTNSAPPVVIDAACESDQCDETHGSNR